MTQVKRAGPVSKNPARDWKKVLLNDKWSAMGYSRAADRTFLYVPQLRMGLDAGGCRGRQPDFVFVTHSHIDHAIDLWYMAQNENTKIFIPAESLPFISRNIKHTWEMNLCEEISDEVVLPLVPVKAGEVHKWGKKDMYSVRIIHCQHKVPSVGYAFYETRPKLKKEYQGMKGKELGALRKSGVEISEEYSAPMFVFMGDTDSSVFDDNPWVFEYPTIITECTFFCDEQERAERDGHTHWDTLLPHILAHPTTSFILIHFSLRYKEQEIYDFFDELSNRQETPLELHNVTLFVTEGSEGKE